MPYMLIHLEGQVDIVSFMYMFLPDYFWTRRSMALFCGPEMGIARSPIALSRISGMLLTC